MAFTKSKPKSSAPTSPDLLFRELPRRKIPDVLPHQQTMMQKYASEAENVKDVALQLPTGSGKTLVGLLIAEWRRRKHKEKVVYLCPTIQLVNQAVSQAENKYGLSVVGFTGSRKKYSAADKAYYNQGDRIAVTTYSSLFNTNPYFSDADIVIVDDAHAAENYVAKMWTLSINRHAHDQAALHNVLSSIFEPHLDSTTYSRMTGQWDSVSEIYWVDKVPTPILLKIHDDIVGVLDTYTKDKDLRYPWSMLRDHLKSCHIYLSTSEIFIRPIIAPTWSLAAFNKPKQRIYMSATLGEGGDLERLMGREKILRLPVPDGWDTQGVGRRFFIFPSLSLEQEEEVTLRHSLLKRSKRSLVLVPSDHMREEIAEDINDNLSLKVFSAEDIELSKDNFVTTENAVAVVANRYDGIDFPGDECRLLCIEGLPKAVNAQERFFMTRMGANILYNERIQTRVLQAIGRCTRSLEDYSAVVVTGDELPDYLSDPRRRRYFHPELQAELWFGVEQSKDKEISDFLENFEIFIENGADWEAVNQMIVDYRNEVDKDSFPSIDQLSDAVQYEVKYQLSMWSHDYSEAVSNAESVISILTDSGLRGYRALWEYLAGSAAAMSASEGHSSFAVKAREHFLGAKKAAHGIPWLVQLSAASESNTESTLESKVNHNVMFQVEKIETTLSNLGMRHDRNYSKREKEILEGLNDPSKFENAHKLLGEHLGYDAEKIESSASPDPWWQVGLKCIVFEDYVDTNPQSKLDPTKARQASSHPAWMKENVLSCKPEEVEIIPVLLTQVDVYQSGAEPHLNNLSLWKLSDFKQWAADAMALVRELRKTFSEPGNLVWRAEASEQLQNKGFDIDSLFSYLKSQNARTLMTEK